MSRAQAARVDCRRWTMKQACHGPGRRSPKQRIRFLHGMPRLRMPQGETSA